MMKKFDALESMADSRHEFGEHGGVNMSIEASTTFTVMEAGIMPEIFQGRRGPDQGGCYLYGPGTSTPPSIAWASKSPPWKERMRLTVRRVE